MSPDELFWLAERAFEARTIIEVGCWKGRSTKVLALATAGMVIAVDHWQGQSTMNAQGEDSGPNRELATRPADAIYSEFCSHLAAEIAAHKLVVVRKSSLDALPALTSLLPGGMADMVFIDADHDYAHVKGDIQGYRSLLAPGGLLCGHDYGHPGWPGVKRAVQELLPSHAQGPGTLWYART